MVDAHITVDEQLLAEVDRISKSLGLDRSQVVSQALQGWLQRYKIEGFEQEWITALQKHPDEGQRAEAWMNIQEWDK